MYWMQLEIMQGILAMTTTEILVDQPNYSFCIYLWGVNLDPDEVTGILDRRATRQKVRGEVTQVEGRPTRVAKIGFWEHCSEKHSNPELCILQLEQFLQNWCEIMAKHTLSKVEELRCEVFVNGNSEDKILALIFPQSLLRLVASSNFPLHVTYLN